MNVRGWFLLVACSFLSGFFIGCGDVTATMVPPAAAEPDQRGEVSPNAAPNPPVMDAGGAPDHDAAPAGGDEVGGKPDASGAEDTTSSTVAPDAVGPPEHPAFHCQGAAADYVLGACTKPACGTCQKRGEASTFASGCWTSDDFHCVASCTECR